MVLVAYRHGLRPVELVTLRWDAIDFAHGQIHASRAKNAPTRARCKRISAIATSSTPCATPSCRPHASRTSGVTDSQNAINTGIVAKCMSYCVGIVHHSRPMAAAAPGRRSRRQRPNGTSGSAPECASLN
jgi:hypothetical protein